MDGLWSSYVNETDTSFILLLQKYTQYEYENNLNKLTNGLHLTADMFFIS